MNNYNEIPACPDYISSPDKRELWMDLCQDLIERKKLNVITVELLKSFIFNSIICDDLEGIMLKSKASPAVAELYYKCCDQMAELSEKLQFTPKDRGLI